MSNSSEHSFSLTPEKRELFSALLKKRGITASPKQSIPRRGESEIVPLSFAQQRLWFIHQLEPDSPAYNSYSAVHLTGQLDVAALEQSVDEIVRRHEALRTTFPTVDGQPIQAIAPALPLTLPVVDLREVPPLERNARAQQLAQAQVKRPFDLSRGPLVRFLLLELDREDYVAVLMMHHIVSDEWSLDIFIRELATLYRAFSNHQPSPLDELTLQYADFALWEQNWLQGPLLEEQLSYWKKQLEGAPPVVELVTGRPRPPTQTFRGAVSRFALSPHLSAALNATSHEQNVTLFMLLLAAFQTLLYRYSGQTDIVVSTGTGNRRWRETERLIGCFINMLLLRANLAGDPSFRELLAQVRRVVLEAYEHQDLPFEKLVEALHPQRSPSYTPLTQVMFVLHNTPMAGLQLPGLKLGTVPITTNAAQFDLLLRMGEADGILTGDVEYNTDLFDPATISRMLGHFQVLLESIVSDPNQHLSELALLTAAERRQLLVEWNNTGRDFPRDQCLHQLFEAQVRRTPNAVAARQQSETMTYGMLNGRANQLAHHLRSLGVGPNIRVGLCVERSFDMIVGLLGILKAGGAYVPLDPAYPQERLAFMMQDAQVRVLLTRQKIAHRLPPCSAPIIFLDSDGDRIARESMANPECDVTPENLVYVIYTSGSTGRPKGVLLNHRGRVNNFFDFNQRFGVGPGDRLIALSSLSFDMCAYDVLGILAAGAAIILPTALQERDPAAWAELLIEYQVTLWHSVPALLELLVEHVAGQPRLYPESLRLVLLGGDWIPLSLPDRLRSMVKGIQVVSMGGATEVSMDSTIYLIQASDPTWQSIPYGQPMTNQLAYVLDSRLQLLPIGIPGELHLGGVGLAWGYLGHPERTAEKFVPNPFSPEAGDRMYKTGDLACYLPDGNLKLLGRMDHQVKIRGFRIELGEITATLSQHAAVREALVVARKDNPTEPVLVAYVIPDREPPPTVEELQSFLKQSLPDPMLPSAFVYLDRWPLTPNGKIDRRALPTPSRETLEKSFVPPRTRTEEVLAQIWAQVLGLDQVGVDDNFFELGGNSIHGIRVLSRARQAGLEFMPKDILQHQTIAELARVAGAVSPISGEQASRPPDSHVDADRQRVEQWIGPAEVESIYPLAPFQEYMLDRYLSEPEPGLFLVQSADRRALTIPDFSIARQVWQRLVERHAILRTSFVWEGLEKPLQVVHKKAVAELEYEDWRGLSAAQQEERLAAYLDADRARGVEPGQTQAGRLFFGRVSEDAYQMIMSFSYLCLDGWSLNLLTDEFAALYEAQARGQELHLDALPPYQDYIVWLQRRDASGEKAYWQKQLDGFASPPALIDRVPGNRPGHETGFARQCTYLSTSTTDKLRSLVQQHHLTHNSLAQAAWALLVSRYTGAEDVVFGVAMFNRPATLAGAESMVGPTLNVLPLRVQVSRESSLLAYLQELMLQQMELTPYAHTPLRSVYEWCGLPQERRLFESYLVFQNLRRTFASYPNRDSIFFVNAGYPLRIDVSPYLEIEVSMSYPRRCFDDASVARMLQDFVTMLEAMAAGPEQPLENLKHVIQPGYKP